MKIVKSAFLLSLFLFLFHSTVPAQDTLDYVVAVVGKDIILNSELKLQTEIYLTQTGQKINSQQELDQLKKNLLEQMINDRLLLAQAQKDTLLKVSDKEIDQTLESQLSKIKTQFPSEEAFQNELKAEGITEAELRRTYRGQIQEQLLRDRLISSRLSKINISSREVKEFYEQYGDSLPEQPESAKLSQIFFKIEPSQKTIDSLKSLTQTILGRAKAGEDFSELAKKYSEDPSAKEGGDLGFLKRGEILPEFEEKAFSLSPGEISDVVQTPLGFHIIKLDEKKEDQIHVHHILIKIQPSPADSARVLNLADSVYQKLKGGADFVQMVKDYSQDEDSKKKGGELDWLPLAQLPPELKDKISHAEIGQIVPPVSNEDGVYILKVLDKKKQRKLSLVEDYDTVKEMARRKKASDEIMKWINVLKEKTYVEERI
ncbi:MAG TPA: peptidylprolyl isomerase [Terriglobales bacterium]|nr:peptidylprolyl isomerase [Terriglobales bacterium]